MWLAYEKIPLSLSSFYIGNPNICKHKKIQKKIKKWPMSSQDRAKKKKKKKKMKNTKIKIKCVGGGANLLYLLCLISNTMPQLEQSSLQPSTYLQHRHLLQTTSYNHLLRLHLLISRKRKHKQQQARNPPPPPRRGVEKPEGPSALQPTTGNNILFCFYIVTSEKFC